MDDRHDVSAYITDDERVLIYDERRLQVHDVTQDPATALEGSFKKGDVDAYVAAMDAISEKAVIDL